MQRRREKEEDDSDTKWGGLSPLPHPPSQKTSAPTMQNDRSAFPPVARQLQSNGKDIVDLLPQEYTNWVIGNASLITSIESSLRGLFFLLPAGGSGGTGSQDSNKTTILVELGKSWDISISRFISEDEGLLIETRKKVSPPWGYLVG